MPYYEYECAKCNYRFEIVQGINDPPIKECDKCHSEVKRVIYASGLIYKGKGFYATDYGKSGKSKLEEITKKEEKN